MMRLHRRQLLSGAAALLLESGLARMARGAAPALPFPEIAGSGSPASLGQAHGRAAASAIKRNIAFYAKWIASETHATPAALLQLAASFAAPLRQHLPEQLEEMEGIARGSGRSLAEILLLNARTDLLILGQSRAARSDAAPGCTALALTGAAGKPLLALGQNWDWMPDLRGGTVVLRFRPARGPRLVTFAEAGMVGKIGFNEHRLGVCLNFLGHRSEDSRAEAGVPLHCLLRAVLGCRSLEEATKLVAWAPRSASANLLLAEHAASGPRALDLELTPTALARLPLRDGALVHTNHFKHPALRSGCTAEKNASTWNRDRVATSMAARLQRTAPDPVRRMQQILVSREGAPAAVSRLSTPGSSSMTLAGIVMDLSRNRLWLTAGPPHLARWTERPGV